MMDDLWQPIETAPRDWIEFQAWILYDGGYSEWDPKARFNPVFETFEVWGRTDYDEMGWIPLYEYRATATHWQPIPARPELKG